jgi:hypothetical protein
VAYAQVIVCVPSWFVHRLRQRTSGSGNDLLDKAQRAIVERWVTPHQKGSTVIRPALHCCVRGPIVVCLSHASTAWRKSVSCLQHRLVHHNSRFPRAKLARYLRCAALEAVSANDTCSSMLSAKVPMPRMAGLKGEAGVSPALSRNCKDASPSQVARPG